jgi:hypothetical protein
MVAIARLLVLIAVVHTVAVSEVITTLLVLIAVVHTVAVSEVITAVGVVIAGVCPVAVMEPITAVGVVIAGVCPVATPYTVARMAIPVAVLTLFVHPNRMAVVWNRGRESERDKGENNQGEELHGCAAWMGGFVCVFMLIVGGLERSGQKTRIRGPLLYTISPIQHPALPTIDFPS